MAAVMAAAAMAAAAAGPRTGRGWETYHPQLAEDRSVMVFYHPPLS